MDLFGLDSTLKGECSLTTMWIQCVTNIPNQSTNISKLFTDDADSNSIDEGSALRYCRDSKCDKIFVHERTQTSNMLFVTAPHKTQTYSAQN